MGKYLYSMVLRSVPFTVCLFYNNPHQRSSRTYIIGHYVLGHFVRSSIKSVKRGNFVRLGKIKIAERGHYNTIIYIIL